jgi:adenosine deaminase
MASRTAERLDENNMRRVVDAMPKVELHFHLRGGIPPYAMWMLARKYRPGISLADYERMLRSVSDFKKFQRVYDFFRNLIKNEEDLEFVARAAARQARRENVIYTEVSFTPFSLDGVSPEAMLGIVRREFEREGVAMSFIGPLNRGNSEREERYKYDFYREARDLGVRGVGLVGDESAYPVPEFGRLFERAKADGFGVAVHAGEFCDRGNIESAVMDLGADRVGHGTNIGAGELAESIIERGVHIEMCPMSNMALNPGITPDNYLLGDYYGREISVGVNSDDPGILGYTLTDNYRFLKDKYKLKWRDFKKMQIHAANAAFADDGTKKMLRDKICAWRAPDETAAASAVKRKLRARIGAVKKPAAFTESDPKRAFLSSLAALCKTRGSRS